MPSGEAYDELNPTEKAAVEECLINSAELGRLLLLRYQIDTQVSQLLQRNIALTTTLSPEVQAVLLAEKQLQTHVAGDLPRQRAVEDVCGEVPGVQAS